MIEAAEKDRLAKFAVQCQRLGDMPKLVKEIQDDAYFPPEAKAILIVTVPRCAAKWLNKSGLSAEYQDEIAIMTAGILIWSAVRKADQRLAKQIAEVQKAKEPRQQAQPQAQQIATIHSTPGVSLREKILKEPLPDRQPASSPGGGPPTVCLGEPQPIATIKQ